MGKKRSIDGEADSELIESIDSLREQVEVLRNAVDELREELQYLVRNPGETRVAETIERLRVTSLPLDPATDDFGQRVNAVPDETVAELRTTGETAQEKRQGPATSQRGLF
ncbi:MAG: hypothetical protein O3C40_05050 [Planctomycetota bacterium]|nr:hypothetical protein [Planctomycetota bacterium]